MKNNNKLAINTIRARKAQKKRANEQDKPKKKGKRWFSRLFALIGCLLLVSALVLPCFADMSWEPTDEPPDYVVPTPDYKQLFYSFYDLSQSNGDALAYLMNSIYFDELSMPFVYQFDIADIGDRVVADEPLIFDNFNSASDASVVLYDNRNGSFYYFFGGYWASEYSTIGTTRIMRFKFYEWNDGDPTEAIDIRLQYDYETLYVVDTAISGTGVDFLSGTLRDFSGIPGSFSIGTSVTVTNNSVLAYITGLSFVRSEVSANFDAFVNGVSSGVNLGFNSGRTQGYDWGYYDGYYFGYEDGYIDGLNAGDRDGYNRGYAAGYEQGKQDGYNADAYQAGYDKAVSEIDSGDWGKNFLANIFNAPMYAMNEFVIASWETPVGTMQVTLGLVVGSVIGLSLFILFLKLFAGG